MKFIFASDFHIREDQPQCRIDDFEKSMWKKFKFLKELSEREDAHIIVAGDVFHRWKASPWLINKCVERLPFFRCIAGNHDLPNHNIHHIKKSALYTLIHTGIAELIESKELYAITPNKNVVFHGFSYSIKPLDVKRNENTINIAVIHRLVTKNKDMLWRNAGAKDAISFIKKLKGYDIIITGDNHKVFTHQYKNTLLINPGSFTRQTAAQMKHKPCVFLYDTQTRNVERIILPYPKGVVSKAHMAKMEYRESQMENFIEKLDDNYELGIKYESNIESFLEVNKEHPMVIKMIWNSIEQCG